MLDSETLEKLRSLSIKERINVIEAILQTVKHDMKSAPSQPISSEHHPLQGKVLYYDDPYESVAGDDWDAIA